MLRNRVNSCFIISGVQDLVATRFISEGEEISISYLPAMAEGSAPSKVRKEYTREWYGFSCICQQCCIKVRLQFDTQ